MALNLVNLDKEVRTLMLDEIRADVENNKLYLSPRLSFIGREDYPTLIQKAAENNNDSWFGNGLRKNARLNSTEQRKVKTGTIRVKVPETAANTLAEGEFNRFYLRGLCLWAIQNGISNLMIYRAKQVENPRPESELKVGTRVNPVHLLDDLRANIGIDTSLGLPPGPNSGLSAKLPEMTFDVVQSM